MSRRFILWGAVFLGVTALFAADLFQMPKLSPDVRKQAAELYDQECYACHRWNRKFAGPAMRANVERYLEDPRALFDYFKDPKPIHPDQYRPMEIKKLSDQEASMMVAWLLSLVKDSSAVDRPR